MNSHNSLIQKMLQFPHHLPGHLLDSLQYVHICLVPGNNYRCGLISAKHRGRIPSIDLLRTGYQTWPQGHIPGPCSTSCPLVFPGPFLPHCFPVSLPPACAGSWGSSFTGMRFYHFSSFSRCLWRAALLSSIFCLSYQFSTTSKLACFDVTL